MLLATNIPNIITPLSDMQLAQHELLKTEREICHNLLFRLHS